MFETTFKLTQQEIYKGLVAVSKSRLNTKFLRILGIFWITFNSISLYNAITNSTEISLSYNLPIVLLLLFGISFFFLAELSSQFQTRNLLKTNAQITETTTYTFDETSFQLKGETFSIRLAYNKLFEVKEVNDFILFRVTEGSANIVPKRALSIDQFISLKIVLSKIPKLKSKFKS